MLASMQKNRITHTLEMNNGIVEKVWQFKTKMQLPYNPAIALLSIYAKEIKTYIKKTVHECS